MSRTIKLKKGLDIRIAGKAEEIIRTPGESLMYGVKPVDFPGLTPRLLVKPGDPVKAGTPLFHNKLLPDVVFTSPVNGRVVDVVRGDRRKLLEVTIEKKGDDYVDFGKADVLKLDQSEVKDKLLRSGLWPVIRQRPYHIIADPSDTPKSVFISGFDTSPLAPDYDYVMDNSDNELFQTGINAVSKLTGGKINLILNGNKEVSGKFKAISGVEITYFSGPHPAGNPGIHIHHIDPVNKGEKVWYINFQDIFAIGRLFAEGIYKPERLVALTGSEIVSTGYYRLLSGASVAAVAAQNIKPGNLRYISGNVLTGCRINHDGYLGFYDSQFTVIPEGDYSEFFGWALPGFRKFSFSRTFASSLFPSRDYKLDTNFHGGERAFVLTGQYEKVVPMDIFPLQLFKAIIAEDIDMMENLGIYEVAEEDFALCEFICPSKTEIQTIIRKGLDQMVKEMS